jgi:MATE family multidrug resistance protein
MLNAACEAAGQALLLEVGVGILLTAAGLIFSRDLLYLLGTPTEMINPGVRYIKITLYFGVFRLVSFVGASILGAGGDTRTPMWATGFMNVLHALGDWVLIFGIGPFLEMGLDGPALAIGLWFS